MVVIVVVVVAIVLAIVVVVATAVVTAVVLGVSPTTGSLVGKEPVLQKRGHLNVDATVIWKQKRKGMLEA